MKSRIFSRFAKPVTRSRPEPTTKRLAIIDERIRDITCPNLTDEAELGETDAEYAYRLVKAAGLSAL